MPRVSSADVRAAVGRRAPAPIYLFVGDDEAEMKALTSALSSLVEDELRAFNMERFYAGEKGVTPVGIVESARQLPLMADRRIVVVLRAERLLKPKRRSAPAADADDAGEELIGDLQALETYVQQPQTTTTLVLVAADIDRSRRIGKAITKHAAVVECWGLKTGKDPRGLDLRQAAKQAEQLVRAGVTRAKQQIEPAAARLLAERAGADIAQLRGDLDRLLLFSAGKPTITLADVREIVSAETAQDDWAVTNAIERGDAGEALRQIALALDGGAVPFMILGQIAWFARERLEPRRVPAAIEAIFRTDLAMKSSGDPRILLERLVVELCGGPKKAHVRRQPDGA